MKYNSIYYYYLFIIIIIISKHVCKQRRVYSIRLVNISGDQVPYMNRSIFFKGQVCDTLNYQRLQFPLRFITFVYEKIELANLCAREWVYEWIRYHNYPQVNPSFPRPRGGEGEGQHNTLVPCYLPVGRWFVCLCWGFTAQSTQWGHVERGQFT